MFLSAITILELEQGILPPQGSALRTWLAGVRSAFEGRVLRVTDTWATICALLHVPNMRSERDAMIETTAIEHGFTEVRCYTQDLVITGVTLFNPWHEAVA